jgi:Bacterial Ig-like domain (group 3)/MBG domain (YGX type)/Bacterial Ig-like domain (group 1)/Beta-propeller repeat
MLACLSFSPSRTLFVAAWIAACTTFLAAQNPSPAKSISPTKPRPVATYGSLPLSFEANQGQSDPRVRFLSRGSGYSLFLTGDGAVLALGNPGDCSPSHGQNGRVQKTTAKVDPAINASSCSDGSKPALDVIRMTLAGGTTKGRTVTATGEDQLPGKVNYFLGNDPTRWSTNLPTYAKVRYSGVYPGVDLVYYGNQHQLEYDFVVAPGSNPALIRLQFAAAQEPRIDPDGNLVLDGANGEAIFHRPLFYQVKGGHQQPVTGNFRRIAANTMGFALGSYDHTRPLIIDPVLVYSTYLGGSGGGGYEGSGDMGEGIAVDSEGSAYVVGSTPSADFPVTDGAYQTTSSSIRAFITKFNSTGTAVIYSTFLGGSVSDSGAAIALDAENNAVITGQTSSPDYPVTSGAYSTTYASLFVTKLNAAGSGLIYSTFIGNGSGSAIALDANRNAYVTGSTSASDFPVTKGAFQTKYLGSSTDSTSAFVTEVNPAGAALVYSTYLGGSGVPHTNVGCPGDSGSGIAVDSSGDAYMTGTACSNNFPVTSGAYQTINNAFQYGYSNAFVTKLNSTGTSEVYSTYLGGSIWNINGVTEPAGSSASAIQIDSSGNSYVGGSTNETDFPVTAGVLPKVGNFASAGFVSKLNPAGTALIYSTYLGGYITFLNALVVDANGYVYAAGEATAGAIPESTDSVDTLFDGRYAAFVVKMNPTATALDFGTLLRVGGAGGWDGVNALAIDGEGSVYVTGFVIGSALPTTDGAFQTVNHAPGDGSNVFVSKLALAGDTTNHFVTSTALSGPSGYVPLGQPATLTVTVTGTGTGPTPTGTMNIFTGTAPISPSSVPAKTLTLNAARTATWTQSSLALGNYSYTATYGGDAANLTSISGTASFTVIGAPSVLRASPQSLVTTYPQPLPSLTVTVFDANNTPLSGISVNFAGAGLTFTPASAVTGSNGAVQVTVTPPALTPASFVATATVSGIAGALVIPVTILPAPLTVTLHPAQRIYGAANPAFVTSISGLLNGDTVTVTPQTTATPSSPVGFIP